MALAHSGLRRAVHLPAICQRVESEQPFLFRRRRSAPGRRVDLRLPLLRTARAEVEGSRGVHGLLHPRGRAHEPGGHPYRLAVYDAGTIGEAKERGGPDIRGLAPRSKQESY
jgi:hypothetical protein